MENRKIEYNSGIYCSWIINSEFNHKNIKVSGIGVDILLELVKDNKPYYFTAYKDEIENGFLPEKPLFNDFYASSMVLPILDSTEEAGIRIEPNFPIICEALKNKFGFIATVEKYYIEGTFLPEERVPSLCTFEITKEFFKNILSKYNIQDFDIVGSYSKVHKAIS